MIEPGVEASIKEFLDAVRKLLPPSFESEDLLEDLRVHITDALQDRIRDRPSESQLNLLREVLDEIGEPEEILEEFNRAHLVAELNQKPFDLKRAMMRFVVIAIVLVVSAWGMSVMTYGQFDFLTTLIVLIIFTILERVVRSWQSGKS